MFRSIFQFELSYWTRNPLVYGFGLILFTLPFLTMWGMSAEAHVGDNTVMMNSYYKINNMANMFSLLLIFILPAIIGNAVFRDYSSRFYTLMYSFPFTKGAYLAAKFLAAFSVIVIVVLALVSGFMFGAMMPGVKAEAMLPYDPLNYLQLVGAFLIPNMLFFGALVWVLTLFTRNIYISFIGVIFMVVIQSAAKGVFGSMGYDLLAAMIDPTGDAAVKYVVRFWTLEERNMNALPISGVILANRLLWLGISGVILWVSYARFSFTQFTTSLKRQKSKTSLEPVPTKKVTFISLPQFTPDFSIPNQLATAWALSKTDFRRIVLSWPFLAIVFAGGVLVLFQQYQMGPMEGVVSIPTTANMLRFPMFFFTIIVNLLTFLYAGILVHQDKLYRIDSLIDITPQPNWLQLLSKLLVLVKMQAVLLTLVMLGGIFTQVLAGYSRFEFGHYFFELFVLQGIHFFVWACMALCVHTVCKNMFWGYFVLLLIPVSTLFLGFLGDFFDIALLKENLLQFNSVKDIFVGFDYSDFDQYGTQLPTYFSYKTYWILLGLILLIISHVFWKRGLTFSWSERWALLKSRFVGGVKLTFFLLMGAFISMGGIIYYQEHVVSKVYFSEEEMKWLSAENEKRYGHFEGLLQPKLSDVMVVMDLYPETEDFQAQGTFTYLNKVDASMDTILIAKSFKEQTRCEIMQSHQVLVRDEDLQYELILLDKGLAKGDSLTIKYFVKNYPNSLLHHNSRVTSNGTFMIHHIFPRLGFKPIILKNKKERKNRGLPDREFHELLPADSLALGYEYAANDMGRITYECIMSTSEDQAPFTMGVIQRKWQEGGRNYVHFQSEDPIVNTLSWLSGTYEKHSHQSTHQFLELYRHPEHGYNDPHIFKGLSASLDYCSHWFGPLTYDTLKVIEFPITRGTYATVHGNLVPYSESYFLCDVDDPENTVFNMPFFVSAHEIAHHWWGHRVDPANVPGGRVITEGMADYLAMKAIESTYEKELVLAFRKKYHEVYLEERAQLSNENPLIHASLENEFLNYRKASLAIYAMSEWLGEDVLNKGLAQFEADYRYGEPPFATSLDFVSYIRAATPDSLSYLIHDLFETITLYDNGLKEVKQTKVKDGYQLEIELTVSKYQADNKGKRMYGNEPINNGEIQSLPLSDYVEIGLFDAKDKLIEKKRIRAVQIDNKFSWKTTKPIAKVQIDPNYLLFDVNRDNDTLLPTTTP